MIREEVRSPFSLYHSGSNLSPPLPTHTWNPGNLAGAAKPSNYEMETFTHLENPSPEHWSWRKNDDGIWLKFSRKQLTLRKEIGFAKSWTLIRSNLTVGKYSHKNQGVESNDVKWLLKRTHNQYIHKRWFSSLSVGFTSYFLIWYHNSWTPNKHVSDPNKNWDLTPLWRTYKDTMKRVVPKIPLPRNCY